MFDLAFARDFFGYVADGVEGQVADHNDDGDLNKQQSWLSKVTVAEHRLKGLVQREINFFAEQSGCKIGGHVNGKHPHHDQ